MSAAGNHPDIQCLLPDGLNPSYTEGQQPIISGSQFWSVATSAFLLPNLATSTSRHKSHSPGASSDEVSSSIVIPPFPTPSAHLSDGKFTTSKEPHGDKPEVRDGVSYLDLIAPDNPSYPHVRQWSIASLSTERDYRTDTDHDSLSPLSPTKSYTATNTTTNPSSTRVDHPSDIRNTKRRGKARTTNAEDSLDDGNEDTRPMRFDSAEDENIDAKPFAFKPCTLACLVDSKNLEALRCMGGEEGLLRGLGTHRNGGIEKRICSTRDITEGTPRRHDQEPDTKDIPGIVVGSVEGNEEPDEDQVSGPACDTGPFCATMEDRRHVYGENVLPQQKSSTLLQLMWRAMKDKILVLLSIAAVVSLALGFFQDFGPDRDQNRTPVDWVEGVAIIAAILLVVLVGSVNDWKKELQFRKLNEKKDERRVKVIRNCVEKVIDIKGVLVGDVALLEPGDIIPCDGVFLSGYNIRCDESGITGESDTIKKISYRECIALREQARKEDICGGEGEHAQTDCFLISGSRVLEGYGKYVVIAVGTKSFNGRTLIALRRDEEATPLQTKLNNLAESIARFGSAAGLLLFLVLTIRFFVQLGNGKPARTPHQNGITFINIFIIAVTLVVVAVPEGLPLAVTLALAFATKRMTKENLLVRALSSCETMANATVVCTDKTGTLTKNVMSVVAGSVGIHAKFVRNLHQRTEVPDLNPDGTKRDIEDVGAKGRKHSDDFSFDQGDINSVLPTQLKKLFNEAIAINSTAFVCTDADTGKTQFVGSKTEAALLNLAKESGWADYKKTRDDADIVQMLPFSSDRKAMGVVVRMAKGWRLHLKGASEILVKACTKHVVLKPESTSGCEEGEVIETAEIDEIARDNISRTIISYADQQLRTIALCYRDFALWPPQGSQLTLDHEVSYEDLCQGLVLIGIAGIEDPLRPGVSEAVASCHKAGVTVKMCTGDNVLTARSIATQCGIYTRGGIIMEGPVFRQLGDKDRLEIVPRLQVLARSSPEDKQVLVETLKSLGETVGVTGDGTNDGPALKAANVGFSMGIAGTDVAKEAADIILMDDNFASIVKAIMWGRCVNDAVRKFLQFQISTNITAVIITFVSAIASTNEEPVLSAVQLLWINIIMDTFAALALATDPASPVLLDRKPDPLNIPLFSTHMIKMILGQSTYQVVVALIFHFLGHSILGLGNSDHNDTVVQTLVFNIFVFAQIFNSINCRGLDSNLNILQGITNNWYFIIITLIEIGGQILIIFTGGAAFQVTRIGVREWGISLALGVVSIPLGVIIRLIPTAPCERLFIKMGLLPSPEVLPTKRTDQLDPAIDLVRDNPWIFANLRGGRVCSSSLVVKRGKARATVQGHVHLSSISTMVPTLIGSSVGEGLAPYD